jgi:hypothetical protein
MLSVAEAPQPITAILRSPERCQGVHSAQRIVGRSGLSEARRPLTGEALDVATCSGVFRLTFGDDIPLTSLSVSDLARPRSDSNEERDFTPRTATIATPERVVIRVWNLKTVVGNDLWVRVPRPPPPLT